MKRKLKKLKIEARKTEVKRLKFAPCFELEIAGELDLERELYIYEKARTAHQQYLRRIREARAQHDDRRKDRGIPSTDGR